MPANKYRNKRTYSDLIGRSFHSDAERRYAEHLWLRQKAGDIRDLSFQKSVKLLGAVSMRVDFYYYDEHEDRWIWDEFKGFETSSWRLQRKLWEAVGPGLYLVTREQRGGYVHEHITPKPPAELIRYVLNHLLETA